MTLTDSPTADERPRPFASVGLFLFFAAIAFCLIPLIVPSFGAFASPPVALALGLVLALVFEHPIYKRSQCFTKVLLQFSVVGLGFGMTLQSVVKAGRDGILFTIATIIGTMLLGALVGRLLGVERRITHLISAGTAICGGSAIAAVAPVIDAQEEEVSVALGTVFILNSVALFLFPFIGHQLDMTQRQFGVWSAIAIHDTSSVVGAAAKFGPEALQIATTVKLTRALWIVPLTLLTAVLFHRQGKSKVKIPYFIFLFFLAAVVRSYVPQGIALYGVIVMAARVGLTLTLFLIGAGLSRSSLRAVGVRPLILGVVLWIAISSISLLVVRGTL